MRGRACHSGGFSLVFTCALLCYLVFSCVSVCSLVFLALLCLKSTNYDEGVSEISYACMCVCVLACVSVCVFACMSAGVHVCMPAYLYVCMSVCLHVCMSACLYSVASHNPLRCVVSALAAERCSEQWRCKHVPARCVYKKCMQQNYALQLFIFWKQMHAWLGP